MKKIAGYPGLVLFVIFLFLYIVLEYVFGVKDHFLRAVFSAMIAAFLSPRKKFLDTQQGRKKQITWIFLKEPIIID